MLKQIKLENFRNHRELLIDFDDVTVLIGKNGAGKSNVLEAVFLLSACRSFREEDKKNLISLECDFARVVSGNLEVFIQRQPYLFKTKVKGVFKKQSEFIGEVKSVIFSPESLNLLSGSPKERRRFLDIMISQSDRSYLRNLMAYEKVRLERNSLLQAIAERRAHEDELAFWDKEIVALGEQIEQSRRQAVGELNPPLIELYREISGDESKLTIDYHTNMTDGFEQELVATRRRDIAAGRTLLGPHRDDFDLLLDSANMANFASRGEVRSAVLALKIAELHFLDHGSKPLLLLDDVFSEFDEERRGHLGRMILEYQTLITTTDESHLASGLRESAKIIKIEGI